MNLSKFNNYIFYISIAFIAFIFTSGITFSDIDLWMKCTAQYGTSCVMHSGITFPDIDLWTRLATGSILFQTGHVLNKDIFSYVPANPVYFDHEWGSGAIFYILAKNFGYAGLFFLKVILIFLIFFLISKIIKLQNKNNNLKLIFFLLAGYSIFMIIGAVTRSLLFTYLFFTLWIYLLEIIRKGDDKKNILIWLFPATMILWVNLHGAFLSGFGLLILYAVGEYLNKNNYLKYLKIFALCIPVTLINPYGVHFWSFMKDAMTTDHTAVGEWQPFDFFGSFYIYPGLRILLFITFAAVIKIILTRTKIDWVKAVLILATFVLTLMHKRHMVFFVICATSFMYIDYIELFKYMADAIQKKYGEKALKYLIIGNKAITFLIISFFLILSVRQFPVNGILPCTYYPVGSLEFIKINGLSGNLSTQYNWGSYALWKLYPQNLVSIDGKYEALLQSLSIKPPEIKNNSNKQINFFDYYHTDIILASKTAGTLDSPNDLLNLKGWQLVYDDPVSYVLVPKNKVKANYIYPDPQVMISWREDLSKNVTLINKKTF